MYLRFYEENDKCPECTNGRFYYPSVENCCCHINPPCSACTDRKLICNSCEYEPEEPDYKDVPVTSFYSGIGIFSKEYKPKPLDNTKIDCTTKMHTAFSMMKEGVYPEGTTIDQVRKVVDGTFGGRFEYFKDGKFKYIAYTD